MKYESQVITYGKPKKVFKKLLRNIYKHKGDCLICLMEEDLTFMPSTNYQYQDDNFYCYQISAILKKFDKFWRFENDLNREHGWEDICITVCDNFESFIQMDSSSFDKIDNGFCYYINLLEHQVDYFKMESERYWIDTYYFMPKAISIDITTVINNPNDAIFEELAQFFGMNPEKHSTNSETKYLLIR